MFTLLLSLLLGAPQVQRVPGAPPALGVLQAPQGPQTGDYLYKTVLLQAAPGELLPLIEVLQWRMPIYDQARERRPLMMRHSQGDHWDLLLLVPMGSFEDYYSAERVARRRDAAEGAGRSEAAFLREIEPRIAWREETFVTGPEPERVQRAFAEHGYYHVEMFIALPGKRSALLEERRMENRYLAAIDRPQNLIFQRVAGAAWDLYTIGLYRDIKHFAESADVPAGRADSAAKAAGFEGANRIGTYMRTLIRRHQDTLATAIR